MSALPERLLLALILIVASNVKSRPDAVKPPAPVTGTAAAEPVRSKFPSLSTIRAGLVDALVIVALVMFVHIMVRAVTGDRIVIEPISLPKDLVELGYTQEGVARHLQARLGEIWIRARSHLQDPVIGAKWDIPDLQIPGAGVSMAGTIGALRQLLGVGDDIVSGEIIGSGSEGFRFMVSISGSVGSTTSHRIATSSVSGRDAIDGLVDQVAMDFYRKTRPIVPAYYFLFSNRDDEAVASAQAAAKDGHPGDDPWAYLILGTAHADMGNRQLKLKNSEEAMRLFREALTFLDKSFKLAVVVTLPDIPEDMIPEFRRDPSVLNYIRLQRAKVLNDMNNPPAALVEIRKALAGSPDFRLALNELGNIQRNLGAGAAREAARQNSGDTDTAVGHFRESIGSFRKALRASADYGSPIAGLANTYFQWGRILSDAERFASTLR